MNVHYPKLARISRHSITKSAGNRRRCRTLLMLLFLSLLTACGENSPKFDVIPISGKVYLQVREAYPYESGMGMPVPYLFLQTEEYFECWNYEIMSTFLRGRGGVEITIRGASLGYFCLFMNGPAKGQFPIDPNSREQTIRIVHNGSVNTFILHISDSSMYLTAVEAQTVVHDSSLVWRYPMHSMRFTCGTISTDSSSCSEFMDTLLSRLNLEEISRPTEGFWPFDTGDPGYPYVAPTRVFRYGAEADFRLAGEILAAYVAVGINDHEGVDMTLRNWRNEMYRSWLLEGEDPQALAGDGIWARVSPGSLEERISVTRLRSLHSGACDKSRQK